MTFTPRLTGDRKRTLESGQKSLAITPQLHVTPLPHLAADISVTKAYQWACGSLPRQLYTVQRFSEVSSSIQNMDHTFKFVSVCLLKNCRKVSLPRIWWLLEIQGHYLIAPPMMTPLPRQKEMVVFGWSIKCEKYFSIDSKIKFFFCIYHFS